MEDEDQQKNISDVGLSNFLINKREKNKHKKKKNEVTNISIFVTSFFGGVEGCIFNIHGKNKVKTRMLLLGKDE